MASFWATSEGKAATGEVEDLGGFKPVPKAWYKSIFESVTVDEYKGVKKVKFKTRIVGDGPGKNRVLFLNLKCWDEDEKKRDRAIQLLVKTFNTVGVKLPKGEPDDDDFSELVDKPLDLYLDHWIIYEQDNSGNDTDEIKAEGNFLINVAAKGVQAGAKAAPSAKKPAPSREPGSYDIPDDDIPF